MDTNDDFDGKELNLDCFYMRTNFGQKYPKTAIVIMYFLFLFLMDVLSFYRQFKRCMSCLLHHLSCKNSKCAREIYKYHMKKYNSCRIKVQEVQDF